MATAPLVAVPLLAAVVFLPDGVPWLQERLLSITHMARNVAREGPPVRTGEGEPETPIMATAGDASIEPGRVALVVGNATYKHAPPLANPVHDARDMEAKLRKLGFDVISAANLDRRGLFDAIGRFHQRALDAGVALFFYAGHGMQLDNANYLVPVDARIEAKLDVMERAVGLDQVMEGMRSAVNMVFLDACRDNPLSRRLARSMGASRSTSATRGLAPVRANDANERLIVYATDPGEVAADGIGRNSPFTAALLDHMDASNVSVNDMLTRVKASVHERTNGAQRPWLLSSLTRTFYFAPSDVRPETPTLGSSGSDAAAEMWKVVRDSGDRALVEDFLERHASSPYADAAQALRWRLSRDQLGGVFRDRLHGGGEGPAMVVIPAGRFRMGCLSNDHDCQYHRQKPAHDVAISAPFALSVHEVTFAEWDACVAGGGCGGHRPEDEGWGRARRPAINVSWRDAQEYLTWLSAQTGAAYRLPSESEWEYAVRAGTATEYHWGNEVGVNLANCEGCGSAWDSRQTAPVGSFAPNAFGLHDMHGNVWEWVEDCWNDSYAGAPADGTAWIAGNCEHRVLRGGSWDLPPTGAGVRFNYAIGDRGDYFGFRVARTLTP